MVVILIGSRWILPQLSSFNKNPSTQEAITGTQTPAALPSLTIEQASAAQSVVVSPTMTEQPVSPLSPLAVEPTATITVTEPELMAAVTETVATPTLAITTYTYQVIKSYPHDPNAFTQGLVYLDGVLYEGTGLQGRSSLRKVELDSGKVLEQVDLTPEYFGEGIAIMHDRIIQLTWQNQRGFIWDFSNGLKPVKDYTYTTEGWGITHDETQLIMSDGSDNLYFWDPAILTDTATQPREIRRVAVRADGQPVVRLNELEYVQGQVLANIWQTDQIARVDPATGNVTGWIDLAGLLTAQERANSDVLNGIAYDEGKDRLFVTGKLWPKLFEIQLVQK
ncbi:MAG: glutaminyl-peptide cyclotransferase [Caldilineaceae bacterium]